MYRIAKKCINAAVAISALSISVAHAQFHSKVINGSDAAPNAWPFMVALVRSFAPSAADDTFCGGSLIGPQHILTAAHCVTDDSGRPMDPRDFVVQIGGGNLTSSTLNGRAVLGITVHPKYEPYYIYNDLAILKLKDPVSNAPIQLALTSDSALYADGTSATVLGYGKTDPNLPIMPFVLQQAQIPVASDQTCLNELGRLFNPRYQLCAGVRSSSSTANDGIDSCNGDSGGPLIVSDGSGGYKQIGVVSWGIGGCANEKTRGVYARIIGSDSFVTSFPMAMPVPVSTPTISNGTNATAGSVITCNPPTYYGDSPTSVTFSWYRRNGPNGVAIPGATSQSYTVQPEDTTLYCAVEASNLGGTFGAANSADLIVSPSEPGWVSDTSIPIGSIRAIKCSKRACSVTAFASDSGSGVRSVQLRAEISFKPKKGFIGNGRKGKTVRIRRTVPATSKFGSIWQGRIPLLRNIEQAVRITLIITDSAGNTNPAADESVRTVVAH